MCQTFEGRRECLQTIASNPYGLAECNQWKITKLYLCNLNTNSSCSMCLHSPSAHKVATTHIHRTYIHGFMKIRPIRVYFILTDFLHHGTEPPPGLTATSLHEAIPSKKKATKYSLTILYQHLASPTPLSTVI